MKETSSGTFPFLNKGSPLSLFLSYLAWLIPVWVTGTALSRGYETFQHQTGGVKTLQMFSVCSRHFEPKTRFISLKVCIYLCCRSQTSRPKWTPSRAPNLCRLLLLPASCLWLEEDHLSCYPPPGCERSQSHLTICPEPCTPHNAPSVSSQQVTRAPTTFHGRRAASPPPRYRHLNRGSSQSAFQSSGGHNDCWTSRFFLVSVLWAGPINGWKPILWISCHKTCRRRQLRAADLPPPSATSHSVDLEWKERPLRHAACTYSILVLKKAPGRAWWHLNHKVSPSLVPFFFPLLMVNRVWILSVLVFTDSSWQTHAFLKSLSRAFYLKKDTLVWISEHLEALLCTFCVVWESSGYKEKWEYLVFKRWSLELLAVLHIS